MSDFWLNIIGFAIFGALATIATVRSVNSLRTGSFHWGAGIQIRRADNPIKCWRFVAFQIVGTALVVYVFALLLYSKFYVDLDWMSRRRTCLSRV